MKEDIYFADRMQSEIPALVSAEDSTNKAEGYHYLAEFITEEAELFSSSIKGPDLGCDPRVFDRVAEDHATVEVDELLGILARKMNTDLQAVSLMFAQTIADQMLAGLAQSGPVTDAHMAQAQHIGQNMLSGFMGAFQNAVASCMGLARVALHKVEQPSMAASSAEWDSFTEQFRTLLMKNIHVLREVSKFHFEVQLVFHNSQGIADRLDHHSYPFKEEKFRVASTGGKNSGFIILDEEYQDSIVAACNNPLTEVSDNGTVRHINFDGPAKGCPVTKMDLPSGNFFNEFCRWNHRIIHRVLAPNMKEHL